MLSSAALLLLAFQNCEKKNVAFDEDLNSKLSGNGGGYDGKLNFYDLSLNGECADGEKVHAKIVRTVENKVKTYYLVKDGCKDVQPKRLLQEDIQEFNAGSSVSSLALAFNARLFEQRNEDPLPHAVPDNLVILACQYEQRDPGLEFDKADGALLVRENKQFGVINSYFLLYERSSASANERVSAVDSALTTLNEGIYSSSFVASLKASHADGLIQAGFDLAREPLVKTKSELTFEGKGRQAASQRTLKTGNCIWKK